MHVRQEIVHPLVMASIPQGQGPCPWVIDDVHASYFAASASDPSHHAVDLLHPLQHDAEEAGILEAARAESKALVAQSQA